MKTALAYFFRYLGLMLATVFFGVLAAMAAFLLWGLGYDIIENGWGPVILDIAKAIGCVAGALVLLFALMLGFSWGSEHLESRRK